MRLVVGGVCPIENLRFIPNAFEGISSNIDEVGPREAKADSCVRRPLIRAGAHRLDTECDRMPIVVIMDLLDRGFRSAATAYPRPKETLGERMEALDRAEHELALGRDGRSRCGGRV